MDLRDTPFAANGNDTPLPVSFNPPSDFSGTPSAQGPAHAFLPEERTTAGTMLSQMMTLSAARAPLMTQSELRSMLQRFSHRNISPPKDVFFYANAEFVELISQAIEDQMIAPSPTGEIYIGVQRLSLVTDHLPRYRALLQNVRHMCLYGLNDLQMASERSGFSHPHLITLTLDRSRRTNLEWFWFSVRNVPGFQTALVAQQVEGDLWSNSQQARMYKGLWTADPVRVQQIVDILRQAARILSR